MVATPSRRAGARLQAPAVSLGGDAGADQVPRQGRSHPPLERRGMVRRSRLVGRLERVSPDVPLILLCAPAGYGKTTALSQWAALGDRAFVWVSLDSGDNDPGHLVQHVAGALEDAVALPQEALAALGTIHTGERSRAHHLLLLALRTLEVPVTLVLDDLHEVQARSSLEVVLGLVRDAPPGLRIAAAARTRPSLGLGRLRAEGVCVEFGREELGFSADETRQVLVAAGQPADPRTVAAVLQRTEGWPAGVYLAALVARQDDDEDAVAGAAAIAGDDVYIADYFRDELLARESPDNVRFLLRTSVLDQMSGPLCDAVLERTGSSARLAEAERRNLFVVPLDDAGQWYRYHRLFGEMLLSELRRREPGEEFRLHRRAAAWFEREGQIERAIGHALAGRDGLTAARLINSRAREYFAAGRRTTVEHWLRSLDEEALLAYPPVAVTAAWLWALNGDGSRAQASLRRIRKARFTDPMPDGSTSLQSSAILLNALLGPLGVERMREDAEEAVRLEPPGSPWRPLALTALGIAHVLTGGQDLAVKEFTLAAESGREGQRLAAALAHAELALLALQRDEGPVDTHVAASLALLDEAGLRREIVAMLTHAVAAWAAARHGDHATARTHAGAAQRLGANPSPAAFPWFGAQVAVALGRVSLELDDPVAARLRVDEARQYLSHLLTEGVLRAQVDDLAARLARHGGQARLPSAMALTAAEVRVLQLLPTHLSLAEIAQDLHVSRNTVKTQTNSIYRKLQAGTRTAAVQHGRDLGLLEP